jgi:uncharacterized protein DUF6876
VAGFPWKQWQLWPGIGGSFAMEAVAALPWKQWQLWRGIRRQRPAESRGEPYTQLWTLWVTEEKTWALTCQDGDYHILWAEGGSYTDFPMDRIDFFVEQGCIMLTSER